MVIPNLNLEPESLYQFFNLSSDWSLNIALKCEPRSNVSKMIEHEVPLPLNRSIMVAVGKNQRGTVTWRKDWPLTHPVPPPSLAST